MTSTRSRPIPHQSRQSRTSLLSDLLEVLPHLRPQLYFKSSLVALSHAIEDQVLQGQGSPWVFANFQKERYYRQEARRYRRISAVAQDVFVLATPETDFAQTDLPYHTIPLDPADPLAQEWHVIVIDASYATCLVCRERARVKRNSSWGGSDMDTARQFDGIWSFDRLTTTQAALALLPKILGYRPDLTPRIEPIRQYLEGSLADSTSQLNPGPFTERLITYLQAGQYKLQRTYRTIQAQERKEHLINRISSAIRQSLDPSDILAIAVQELGQVAEVGRCLIYRYDGQAPEVRIEQEYRTLTMGSLKGSLWPIQINPFLREAIQSGQLVCCEDSENHQHLGRMPELWRSAKIRAWVAMPILYQGRLLGILELHHEQPHRWQSATLELAEAIANQVGVALLQAEAYQHLEELNQQLEALDQAKSELIAVTGHELRTPLSTIQVCLESLASDPDMPLEMRQEMLNTALQDASRLRELVQDFLTLSKLESGRIRWHIEPLSAQECVDLALSNIKARRRHEALPAIEQVMPKRLPMVRADGEWLVEVLRKLLDNACKFTPASGQIWIRVEVVEAAVGSVGMVKFTVADSGRGIEPDRLQAIFDRFYQAEGSLRRSVGGTGLGLAICRLIIEAMGGRIWAESAGLDQGSAFHFTLPMVHPQTQGKLSIAA
ncbi:DICT sensory domain-containing protein [Thermostichus vulcanus]|uniref:histidine kinase n=1 Tax=Thermostichus vulcanus str. 'Rupite' TaxID=2813851 RepID=A0ABT0CEZ1_THEVL|nr:DICT sensory domain-containing protein [Thermostichus vulcanus]MCJ2544348.1 GAF domain-containing protein [Thermostichus vulcanus str. 'Rupite']